MKIDDSLKKASGLATGNIEAKTVKNGSAAKVEAKIEKGAVEKITLSTRSSELQSLETKAAAEDTFDAKKVEAIKSAILDGNFKIDSEKVADGLINTVKDLLTNK
ncbi:MAG: flagellar biosynthesis anti-sigma factor FlgM [Methylophilaceae bacterium]|nr:flagellar biosynthesis anti-sigma factor FlgM [Methylophilaceae bacterium]